MRYTNNTGEQSQDQGAEMDKMTNDRGKDTDYTYKGEKDKLHCSPSILDVSNSYSLLSRVYRPTTLLIIP